MTTPKKYRDQIFTAIVRYMEAPKRTWLERRNAYEDLMVVIDAVIEELSEPKGTT